MLSSCVVGMLWYLYDLVTMDYFSIDYIVQ